MDDKLKKSFFKSIIYKIKETIDDAKLYGILFIAAMALPAAILSITEDMGFFGSLLNIVFSLAIYSILISLPKRPGIMMLSLFLMIVLNAFQIVVLYLYGESIIAVDMFVNCLTTNTSEASELLSNLFFPILINAVIYIPLLSWAVYSLIKKIRLSDFYRLKFRRWGLNFFVIAVVCGVLAHVTYSRYSLRRNLYPVNVICNIFTALQRTYQSNNFHKTSANFKFNAKDTHNPDDREIYVLVIGETSRACNWELFGYDRPTNPKLSKRNDLVYFQRAISQSNTTHKSVPLMLTHTTPADFDSIRFRKSIITAFDEAGYNTSFFSNQSKNHSYTQFFTEEANNIVYLDKNNHFDMHLLENLRKQVADTTVRKQFIVLHSYGSHFNYKDRYPSEYSFFKPDQATQASRSHRNDLLNAYDNAIRYTDNFLDSIISILKDSGAKASMIYTSDHGEDIFDDSRNRFLHASPVPTYYQLHVPLITWQSQNYRQTYPEIYAALKQNSDKYVATSQTIFHTLLDIAGIKTDYNDSKQSVASASYISPAPVYLTDLDESVSLEDSGIKIMDLEIFRKLGVLK